MSDLIIWGLDRWISKCKDFEIEECLFCLRIRKEISMIRVENRVRGIYRRL